MVRINPISGPGVCGAEYPLKVAALGEGTASFGFADESLRPPGNIGNQPRWPVAPAPAAPPPQRTYPDTALRQPAYAPPSNGPISLAAPGVAPQQDEINLPAEGEWREPQRQAGLRPRRLRPRRSYILRVGHHVPRPIRRRYRRRRRCRGPAQGNPVSGFGSVSMKPTATLACPIVSALDRWLAEFLVQPAAMRWFGNRVVEIKQISAYSCRGMNGNPHAHISEHVFLQRA